VFNIIVMRASSQPAKGTSSESAADRRAGELGHPAPDRAAHVQGGHRGTRAVHAVGYWNSWFNVLSVMPADSVRWPLQMVMYDYVTEGMTMPGSGTTGIGQYIGTQQIARLAAQMAWSALTVLPILIVYPFVAEALHQGSAARRDQGLIPLTLTSRKDI